MSIFKGRSMTIVRDLSLDEQVYLYDKTRALKEAIKSGGNLDEFKLNNPDLGVYLFFMEDSTRTKESFRNAALFHNVKLNDFDAKNSSFNKKESITDTIRMLTGYSQEQSIFIVRSSIEGLCRWLENDITGYTGKLGLPRASFLNAGDGKHEHPTQEFLDEFSFLEHKNWNRDEIHIALVGDLFHGRTVHAKVDGLRVFKKVKVDLVAPSELAMPAHYVKRMEDQGFEVSQYESIDAYLTRNDIADTWYFTRLQLERMGDTVLDKAAALRHAVSFREEFISRMPANTKFFHPLPRHSITPTIPTFLDATSLNGWDEQSVNGYYTRIIELAMAGGKLGADFTGATTEEKDYTDDFVTTVSSSDSKDRDYKIGIKPVENGIVIDHIGAGQTIDQIWEKINKIRRILKLSVMSSHGVYSTKVEGVYKGIISLPDITEFGEKKLKKLAAIAPGCTLNIIKNKHIEHKYRIAMPPRIYNFEEISCKNKACVSRTEYAESVFQEFYRTGEKTFTCKYCEKPHSFGEIW